MFDGSSIEGFVIQEADMFLCPDLNAWIYFTLGKT